jgi:hypothetical protein
MAKKRILPEGLSTKALRRLSGQRGAKASHWRHGFNSPLSPKGAEAWRARVNAWEAEK